jgi:transcriptional regulator with XRE-family HTH domain
MNTSDAPWSSARARSLLRARDLGGMIRFARQARGWRQDDLATAAGYSRSTISRMETGARAGTDVQMIRHVAAAAGIPSSLLSELLGIASTPAATLGTSIATPTDGWDDPVRRRQLLASLGLAAAGAGAGRGPGGGRMGPPDAQPQRKKDRPGPHPKHRRTPPPTPV